MLMEGRIIATAAAPEAIVDDEREDDVILPIEDSIDLHAFAPRDVRDVVGSYLEAAHEAGFLEVRIVHGRGIGMQRESVRGLLAGHPLVRSFADAPPQRGGWGATIVLLKPGPGGAG